LTQKQNNKNKNKQTKNKKKLEVIYNEQFERESELHLESHVKLSAKNEQRKHFNTTSLYTHPWFNDGRVQIERVYDTVVSTCAQMSAGLAYADLHPNLFPERLFSASDLVPCPSHPNQLHLPSPVSNMIGMIALNKTMNGTEWNVTAIDEEIQFLRPIIHMLPTFLAGNPETTAIYFLGHTLKCGILYSYPARDFCGLIGDGLDLCEFYVDRYNLYTSIANLQADFEQGGHWSEPLQSRGQVINAYTIPIADSHGVFRAQVHHKERAQD